MSCGLAVRHRSRERKGAVHLSPTTSTKTKNIQRIQLRNPGHKWASFAYKPYQNIELR